MTTAPVWVDSLISAYRDAQAHAFLLHGTVTDYVAPGVTLDAYLTSMFAKDRIVVFFDPARGLRFPLDPAGVNTQKLAFASRVGLLAQAPQAAPQNQAMAALMGASASKPAAPRVDDIPLPTSPVQCVRLLEQFLLTRPGNPEEAEVTRDRKPAVVLFHLDAIATSAETYMTQAEEREIVTRLCQWGTNVNGFARTRGIVVGVTRNLLDVNEGVRSMDYRWHVLNAAIPGEVERLEMVEYLTSQGGKPVAFEDGLSPQVFARITAGLSRFHLEDIYLRAQGQGTLTLELIRERKNEIISQTYGDVIRLVDPRWTLDQIAGKKEVKAFLKRNIVRPLLEGNLARCAKGALFMGPAGTGKTVVAEGVAGSAKVNYVVLDLSKILGKFVGESEKNLAKALEMIDQMAPTIVFIDEAEGSFPRRDRAVSGDSGVSNRVMTTLMQFMSDKKRRGRVVFLLASNYPNMMDDAFIRTGRIDAKVPFLVPDQEEREALLALGLADHPHDLTASDFATLAQSLQGYTGAEIIDGIAVKAVSLAQDEAEDWREATVHLDHLQAAMKKIRRTTQGIAVMTEQALRLVDDLDLLPESYREAANALTTEEVREEEAPVSRMSQAGRSL